MGEKRQKRVSELIKRIVGKALASKVKNMDAQRATVVGVEVTPDLKHVKVYFSVAGSEAQRQATLRGLKSATGFLKHEIGAQAELRFVPDLQFIYDSSMDEAEKIEKILRSLK